MSARMLPQLAALDMAGTTIDDHGLVYRALQESVEETGARVAPSDLQELMGAEKRHAIRELSRRGGVELDPEQTDERFDRFRDHLRALYREDPPVGLPGVLQSLQALREAGVKVALTTGFSEDIGRPLVDLLGWGEHLDAVVCASEVPQGRPAPYMIFRAMERTGVLDVARVLVAGDTVVDIRAGVHAGAGRVYAVLTGAADRAALAGHGESAIIQGVRDLPGILGI